MMKRLLPCLLLSLLLLTCKKKKEPVPAVNYNIVGIWSLHSYQNNFGKGANATVTQYPCLGYNTLIFYNDSTASQIYTGIDTCFITPTHVQANGAQDYGLPGLLPLPSKWSQKGNIVKLIYQNTSLNVSGVISGTPGKLQITFKDTVVSGGNTYYITSVEVQE